MSEQIKSPDLKGIKQYIERIKIKGFKPIGCISFDPHSLETPLPLSAVETLKEELNKLIEYRFYPLIKDNKLVIVMFAYTSLHEVYYGARVGDVVNKINLSELREQFTGYTVESSPYNGLDDLYLEMRFMTFDCKPE